MAQGDVMMCVRKRLDADRDLGRADRGYQELGMMLDRLTGEEHARYLEVVKVKSPDNGEFVANVSDKFPQVVVNTPVVVDDHDVTDTHGWERPFWPDEDQPRPWWKVLLRIA